MTHIGRFVTGAIVTFLVTFLVYFINPWVGCVSSFAVFTLFWLATKPVGIEYLEGLERRGKIL